jgi:hypothetical protein
MQNKEYQGLKIGSRKYYIQQWLKIKIIHGHNLQELWNIIKLTNLKIHCLGEGIVIQTKDIGNQFSEIKAANFPNFGKDIDIQV